MKIHIDKHGLAKCGLCDYYLGHKADCPQAGGLCAGCYMLPEKEQCKLECCGFWFGPRRMWMLWDLWP